jgi:hypothetical protein
VADALRGLSKSFISDANETRNNKQARSILIRSDDSKSDQPINFLTPLTIDKLVVDRLLTEEDKALLANSAPENPANSKI